MASMAATYESPLGADARAESTGVRFEPTWPVLFVVPAFNEEANLPRLLTDLAARPALFPEGSRVVVVDDGSADGTVAIARNAELPYPVEVVELGENMGPGAAFRAGFAAALAGCPDDAFVVTLEADTTSDLDRLPPMLERAEAGYDLVLASVHGGGTMVNVSPVRRMLSVGAGMMVRVALGLDARTVSSFFRVYRASILRRALDRYGDGLIEEPGFACKAELLAKLSGIGARIDEVPVDLDASRRIGESRMRVLPTLGGYARLMVRQRTRKGSAPA